MRFLRSAIALTASAMLAVPEMASCSDADLLGLTTKQFGSHEAVVIDPSQAYITFRQLQHSMIRFLRLPTPEERSDWERERADAFARAHAINASLKESDFNFPPLEMRNFAGEGDQIFDHQDGLFTILIAVKPGTYVLYGVILPADTCLCMGTVKFEAAAGTVTDLGRIRLSDDWDGTRPPANPAGNTPLALIPDDNPLQIKGRLVGLPVKAADFHAVGKLPNYNGVFIDRLPPIPGVLEYERDKVIDVKNAKATK